jgi:RNA polymerase sigma-70 factor (ECF subfamily)
VPGDPHGGTGTSFFREATLPDSFAPFLTFRERFGFVPNLFRAQSLLPRVIEAEAGIAGAILLKDGALGRIQKERILLVVAAGQRNTYCVTAHSRLLRDLGVQARHVDALARDYRAAGLGASEVALLDFAVKLATRPTWFGRDDVDGLRARGFSDAAILEGVLMTALARFLCTLSCGLRVVPDFPPVPLGPRRAGIGPGGGPGPLGPRGERPAGPFLAAVEMSPGSFPPFAFFEGAFGFVPNIFRAQTLRPDVVEAEANVVGAVLLRGDVLRRVQKEYILLAISAANLNTYCVAVHCEMLRGLGIPDDASDQIALDHRSADLPEADKELLDVARKLHGRPDAFSADDLAGLLAHGFREDQVLEAMVMTALTEYLNTLQMGLGTVPDFAPRLLFPVEVPVGGAGAVNPGTGPIRPIPEGRPARPPGREDPDADLVARSQAGEEKAFEALIRRHDRRLYRTLVGITGDPAEAEDALQAVLLKAFEHMGSFRHEAKFSTWLTRIAANEGIERVRRRRPLESLAEPAEDEPFVPRQVRAWVDDPEAICSRAEISRLVGEAVLRLPPRYRAAVTLRDLEGLSTEEAAVSLGLPVPTLKTHLLRGRLLLREALAPHFSAGGGRGAP